MSHVTHTEIRERFQEIGLWAPAGTAKQMDTWLNQVAVTLFTGSLLVVDNRQPPQKYATVPDVGHGWITRLALECGLPL